MALHQLLLVAFNRTTLDPVDWRYDVGVCANWVQIFGRRATMWPLPLQGDGPGCNGLSWPLSPHWASHAGAVAPPEPLEPDLDSLFAHCLERRWARVAKGALRALLLWERWFFCGSIAVGACRACASSTCARAVCARLGRLRARAPGRRGGAASRSTSRGAKCTKLWNVAHAKRRHVVRRVRPRARPGPRHASEPFRSISRSFLGSHGTGRALRTRDDAVNQPGCWNPGAERGAEGLTAYAVMPRIFLSASKWLG
eukprot:1939009-Prymnesium_polylepis.1